MADSLRDQLIAAGFEAPKKPVKKTAKKAHGKKGRSQDNSRGHSQARGKNADTKTAGKPKGQAADGTARRKTKKTQSDSAAGETPEVIARRKELKAKIKQLIDKNKLENWKGEIVYRYTVDKRIRELYVNKAAHKQLTARNVAITRLNGDTYLVPVAIATDITKINPQWSVFNTTEIEEDTNIQDDEYSKFQVPDDLQW